VWATWCGPCIKELPHIQQLSSKYAGKVQIMTILYDSSASGAVDQAKGIISSIGFTLPVLRYNDSVKKAFENPHLNPPALPTTFFINTSGKLVKVVKGSHDYNQWCAEIDKLL
ncbi:MAG: TlpA family protein disulfide reductase, partial [Clostridia bacterium]|nr:TlpA family protein disulfide reductase [Clostridia bacterium]